MEEKKHGNRWCQFVIANCIIFCARSSGLYEMMRRSGIFQLPSRKILKRFVGQTKAEIGVTTLAKRRLNMEYNHLSDAIKHVSIMIDEVAIKPKQTYLKNVGKIIGHVDLDGKAVVDNQTPLPTNCKHLQSTVTLNLTRLQLGFIQ